MFYCRWICNSRFANQSAAYYQPLLCLRQKPHHFRRANVVVAFVENHLHFVVSQNGQFAEIIGQHFCRYQHIRVFGAAGAVAQLLFNAGLFYAIWKETSLIFEGSALYPRV